MKGVTQNVVGVFGLVLVLRQDFFVRGTPRNRVLGEKTKILVVYGGEDFVFGETNNQVGLKKGVGRNLLKESLRENSVRGFLR